ncbi:unnamed protein product [Sphagnum tenellum]
MGEEEAAAPASSYIPKNILITGAAGFIASHVASRLIRKYPQYKIVVLDKLDYCSNLKNLSPAEASKNFKFVKGDIGSADLVNYLLITEGALVPHPRMLSISGVEKLGDLQKGPESVTGRPNVDWCESHKVETICANVVGTLTLADVCKKNNLLLVNFPTGCIFEYDETHQLGSGIGLKEEDTPNFFDPYYSKTKAMVEELLKEFDNVCTLRVRMPITSDLQNPRNFITKISQYQKVVNIPNSMTILDELLPISIEMAKRNLRGIWNFTNPGVVSHNEILEMYRQYIDPTFSWKNFTLEEQAKVIIAARSNNELDASKLHQEFPEMLPIKQSLIKYVFEPNRRVRSK